MAGRYPQRCRVCGNSWLSQRWQGPKQCPAPTCASRKWKVGPTYMTAYRKAQGWRAPVRKRGVPAAEALRDLEELYPDGEGWRGWEKAQEVAREAAEKALAEIAAEAGAEVEMARPMEITPETHEGEENAGEDAK